jgi:hypothetical protein
MPRPRAFLFLVEQDIHDFPSPDAFVVKRLEKNSRSRFVPTRPGCSLLLVSRSYQSPRLARSHAEGILGGLHRGCLCRLNVL